ncbi:aldo/keto reductase [Heliobacillus mobilis]|uniref:Aldo/keto reductase n=1 Tax=Heliobacterium mobile TaxID=28064 RepID=A0A6I3SGM1_HELMO|nr:aldo/keto reductase [Heliobacterium mobile]MTV47980.1 aldo/keto reductase [Heliobacterium mobile]
MRYLEWGRTGLKVSEVGFGGIPIIRLGVDEATKVLHRAYDKGINFYDTANAYRDSEEKIGFAFAGIRDKVIIATKTGRRDAKGAVEHLENSLKMLRTDYIDLYQLHQVSQERDWDALTAPGGALEVLQKAKEQGKIRLLGVTSHSRTMAVKLVKTGLFATVQFPFNFIEDAAKEDLFPAAGELGLGILAMKPFAGGMIDNARLAFKFLRQFPDILAIPGFDSVKSVDEILSIYEQPNHITEEDLVGMEQYKQELGQQFCRRCEYCQPCPSGVMITPAMGYKVLAMRMSPSVAVEFLRSPMESVTKCVDCGACIKRCPYDLPIPDMLKKHYDMWEEHKLVSNK